MNMNRTTSILCTCQRNIRFLLLLTLLSGDVSWGQSRLRTLSDTPFNHLVLDKQGGHAQIGDIDGDGRNDIVIHHQKYLAWFPYPSYQKQMIKEGNFSGDRFTLTDLDKDGDLDLVSGKGRDETDYQICWYENPRPLDQKTSTWREHVVGTQGQYIKDLMATDMDQDGQVDVIARSHGYTHIFFQQKEGWKPRRVSHPFKEGMALADLDRDGDKDIILNGFWLETPTNPRRVKFTQHTIAEKWFTQKSGGWQDNCASVAVGDINGDGLLDVLLSHSEKVGWPVAWYSVDSTAQAKTGPWRERVIADVFDWCETLQVGDINRDGYLDVVAAKFERDHENPKYMNEPPFPVVVFYHLKGDGSQWTSQKITDTGVYAGILGDVGSDRDLDIVGPRSYWTGPVELWENESSSQSKLPLNQWHYIQVDDARDKRSFGLAFEDFTGDGYVDIVSGKWFYRNPGGNMTGAWERIDIDDQIDALVVVDVDGDEFGDIIGLRPHEQYWYEAADKQGSQWRKTRIGSLPIDDHRLSTQIYGVGQLIPGGKPEIILSNYFLTVPVRPHESNWPATKYSSEGNGYAIGDIDRDGLLDIGGSYRVQGKDLVPGTRNVTWSCSRTCWWKNPGNGRSDWQRFDIGTATHADRYALVDLNGDERLDLVITEERYPGHIPNGSCYWFEQPSNLTEPWSRHLVVTQLSMNNLDVGDIDRDGDIDLVTCEHTMPYQGKPAPGGIKLEIWENDGRGRFTSWIVDREKESHLGAQLVDLEADGDLDIISIAWRDYKYLHIWRNDAVGEE